jgi:cytosine/adenosine deaminase-related metal-dependent hydrolase
VYVQNRRIVDIREANAAAPAGFPPDAPRVDTGGVIYPGLIDLHNHLPYNILPLWNPPARFDNRDQWRARREYRRDVSEPMDTLTASGPDILKAIIRYIEVKLLMGGVTSGQGMRSRFGGNQFYQGMVRNFEVSDDPVLRAADSRVLDVDADGAADFGRALDRGRVIFYHLSEGLDARARQHYTVLEQNGLLRSNLVGIHSLALRAAQFRRLATAKTSVVWSPLSNSILYGSTINPKTLVDSGVRFGLGSDWTPSGSGRTRLRAAF